MPLEAERVLGGGGKTSNGLVLGIPDERRIERQTRLTALIDSLVGEPYVLPAPNR